MTDLDGFETVELRLPSKLIKRLEAVAKDSGVSIEQVIAVLIIVGLPDLTGRPNDE